MDSGLPVQGQPTQTVGASQSASLLAQYRNVLPQQNLNVLNNQYVPISQRTYIRPIFVSQQPRPQYPNNNIFNSKKSPMSVGIDFSSFNKPLFKSKMWR